MRKEEALLMMIESSVSGSEKGLYTVAHRNTRQPRKERREENIDLSIYCSG